MRDFRVGDKVRFLNHHDHGYGHDTPVFHGTVRHVWMGDMRSVPAGPFGTVGNRYILDIEYSDESSAPRRRSFWADWASHLDFTDQPLSDDPYNEAMAAIEAMENVQS